MKDKTRLYLTVGGLATMLVVGTVVSVKILDDYNKKADKIINSIPKQGT